MIEYFTAAGSAPFTVALLVMVGLAAVELIAMLTGFTVSDIVDEFVVSHTGIETIGDAPTGMEATSKLEAISTVGRFLAWLYVGKVPVLIVLIVFLTVFGLTGLIMQGVLRDLTGYALPAVAAAPLVLFGCLPLVRACTGGLARIMPRDESSAVSPDTFIGRTALIVGPGSARAGMPCQARLVDTFGTHHYVMVEPEDGSDVFEAGSTVLLVRNLGGGRFSAIANPNPTLLDE
ncbi:MAG TPA: YqiJ family protein [Xanthomonadaceae bacterium]|nr:YqiJ family protein [Xanthomonadaceae bacterium]